MKIWVEQTDDNTLWVASDEDPIGMELPIEPETDPDECCMNALKEFLGYDPGKDAPAQRTMVVHAWTRDNDLNISIVDKPLKQAVEDLMPETYNFPPFEEIWKTLEEKGEYYLGGSSWSIFSLKGETSEFGTKAVHMKDWTTETLGRYNLLFIEMEGGEIDG